MVELESMDMFVVVLMVNMRSGGHWKEKTLKNMCQNVVNRRALTIMKLAKELSVDVHRSSSVYYGLL